MATNLSHPLVRFSPRHALLARCAARGLGLEPHSVHHSHRTTDWWIWSVKDVVDLMAHVSSVHRKPFLHAYVRYPASDPMYYGLYVQHVAPYNTAALSPLKRAVVMSIPEVFIEHDLAPKGPITDELSQAIWPCKSDKLLQAIWTIAQRKRILSAPLHWVHGWRFEHLTYCRAGGKSLARELLQMSPSVTWATSNFRGQLHL